MNLTGCTFAVAQKYLKRNAGRVEYALNDFYDHVDAIGTMRQAYSPRLVAIFEKYSCDQGKHCDPTGLVRYIEDMGLSIEDPVTLCLSKILCIEDQTGLVSREQFLDGWTDQCCDSMDQMKELLETLREKLKTDKEFFKSIYMYTFPLNVDSGTRQLPRDVAIDYWRLLFGKNSFALKISKERLDSWVQFIESDDTDKRKLFISQDIWLMFYKFVEKYPDDVKLKSEYDEMAAWPLLIDEYYEYLEELGLV